MIIGILNQKGGVGKSSTSVHLAYWLAKQGKAVLLVDADVQRSSSKWACQLESPIPSCTLNDPNEILDQTPIFAEQNEVVVVDGPAGLTETTRAVMLRADLVLCPVQPSELDLASANDSVYLIGQAQSIRAGLPKAALFLSRATRGTRLKDEAIAILRESRLPTLKTVIHQRQIIADAPGQQMTVFEMSGKPAADAALEYADLFTELMEL